MSVVSSPGNRGSLLFTSSVPPNAENDTANGCEVGDFWLQTTSGAVYVCSAATAGIASWNQVSSGLGIYDVRVFGAQGDGVTDDTAAIQAATTAAAAVRGVVLFPQGTYNVSASITTTAQVAWIGSGMGDQTGTNAAATIIKRTADVVVFKMSQPYCRLENLTIYAPTAGTADGIWVGEAVNNNGAGGSVVRNVAVIGVGGNGLWGKNGNAVELDNVRFVGCVGHGLFLDSARPDAVVNANQWFGSGIAAFSCGGDGVHIDKSATNTFNSIDSEGNTGWGIWCNRAYNRIYGGYVENNTAGPMNIGASCFDYYFVIRSVSGTPTVSNAGGTLHWLDGSGNAPLLSYDGVVTNKATRAGGLWTAASVKTANYTAGVNDHTILCDTTGGTFTVTLPGAANAITSGVGKRYVILVIAGTAPVLVATSAAQTIDGVSTIRALYPGEKLEVVGNGSNWNTEGRKGRTFNVRDYGARGDNATDDSAAISAASTDAAVNGDEVYFPPGTYIAENVTLFSNVRYNGVFGSSVLKLKASNVSGFLLRGSGASGLMGGSSTGGIVNTVVENLILDGNKANNTTGVGLQLYGYGYVFRNLIVRNFDQHGIESDWNGAQGFGQDGPEAQYDNVKVHDCDGMGLRMAGPHDSKFSNCVLFRNNLNLYVGPNAVACQFVNCHSWSPTTQGVVVEGGYSQWTNCSVEGAGSDRSNFVMLGGGGTMAGVHFYGTDGSGSENATGLQLGQTGTTSYGSGAGAVSVTGAKSATGMDITAAFDHCGGTGGALAFTSESNNTIRARFFQNQGTYFGGSPSSTTSITADVNGLTADGTLPLSGTWKVTSKSNQALFVTNAGTDVFNVNSNSGKVEVPNNKKFYVYSSGYSANTSYSVNDDGALSAGWKNSSGTLDAFTGRKAGGLIGFNGALSLGSLNQGAITNGATVTVTSGGNAFGQVRVNPAAGVTGIILQAGSTAGQEVTVVNESVFDVAFAAPSTSNVANGIGCVVPGMSAVTFTWNSGNSRWFPKGLPQSVYYATSYGVRADGATDDLAALNTAIASVSALGGGVLILPSGTILVTPSGTGTSLVAKPNVTLRGQGAATRVKVSSGASFQALFTDQSGTPAHNFRIEDLVIDGNSANAAAVTTTAGQEQYAVRFNYSAGVKIRRCRFENCHGLNTIVGNGLNCTDWDVSDNYGEFVPKTVPITYDNSFMYLEVERYTVHKNVLKTAIGNGARGGIEVHRTRGNCQGNIIDGFRHGINVVDTFTENSPDDCGHVVNNNQIVNCVQGIFLWPTTHRTGTAQAGAAGTITLDAGAVAITGFYVNWYVKTTGGTGSGQTRRITAYNGSTKVATVDSNWTTNPDNTTTFKVYRVMRNVQTCNNTIFVTQKQHTAGAYETGGNATSAFAGGIHVIWSSGQSSEIDGWKCNDNEIEFEDEGAGSTENTGVEFLNAGLSLTPYGAESRDVQAIGNTIKKAPAVGIRPSGSQTGSLLKNSLVAANTITDAGQNAGITNGAWRTGIFMDAANINGVEFRGNAINDTGAAALKGVNAAWIGAATTAVVWKDNVRKTASGINLPLTGFNVAGISTGEGVSADRGDASVTLVWEVDAPIQRAATTLTANRTYTLSATNAVNGAKFRVVRTGLGAFTLDVGGLKTIPSATAAFVDVTYDGTAWRLTGYGTL
jgi:hypothetical protein